MNYPQAYKYFAMLAILIASKVCSAQPQVSITIDDMPKPTHYGNKGFQAELIDVLDSMQIPIAIFITEGNMQKGDGEEKGLALLERWISARYTTVGNHSYSHYACSDVGTDSFLADVKNGEDVTLSLAKHYNKELKYFRFPFNNLGKDSTHQASVAKGLQAMGYIITPFTIDSDDWMYNFVYEYYLNRKQLDSAKIIADKYIAKTMWAFEHHEQLSMLMYNEPMKHIYLCHDNILNARYLPAIAAMLADRGYKFISLDDALTDKRYEQTSQFHKPGGISWMYRWFNSEQDKRYEQLVPEPNDGVWEIFKKTYKQ